MYEEKPQNKLTSFISIFLSEYLVWLIIIAVFLIWYFYPDLIESFKYILLFWAPAIIILIGFLIALTKDKLRTKRDEENGITQYDIIITKTDFYLSDLLVYFGTLIILVLAFLFDKNNISIIDLLQALIFFIFATWLKNIFYNKIIK
jgi:hypothetical protein